MKKYFAKNNLVQLPWYILVAEWDGGSGAHVCPQFPGACATCRLPRSPQSLRSHAVVARNSPGLWVLWCEAWAGLVTPKLDFVQWLKLIKVNKEVI
jgi:hypothetical protein